MKEFVEKLIEKIKVTSLEIIVTGTKDKPYFEIKYKVVGKEDYNIGYSSYDLNNVLNWKEECFEIVNQLGKEMGVSKMENTTWIPYATNEELPHNGQKVWLSFTTEYSSFVKSAYWIYDHFEWANGKKVKDFPSAWKPYKTPAPYQKGE